MDSQRWQQIEGIFQSAVDLAPGERAAFVADICGTDDELKSEVEKLLADYDSADSFIESPIWTDSLMFDSTAKREIADSLDDEIARNTVAEDADPLIGNQIGVYRLTRELGRGGMGAVYLGERADGEFRQSVAVKLIKRGMDTDFIIRRFRHERQILAALDHANIARLLDGGTTGDGLPYFVMEYVEGEPLHRFCDQKRLSITERLRLFQRICSAVAYAHEHQIVHRDIKPGNILVTPAGIPKLLDFGIAKILDPDLIHESINPTSTMMRLMTPEYASPEQVRGLPVTPSSDVYALGVLFYELLTGHRPYSFAGRSPHEISRVICETEAELPSRSIVREENLLASYLAQGITAEKAAEMRGNNLKIGALQRELAGNLDNIALKTLCKTAAGRYLSVKDFSDDIARHLEGLAALAEPCVYAALNAEQELSINNSIVTGSKSLAVLPFKLLGAVADENTGDKFLGIGLADALITRLSNVRRFVVRPTSSVLRYGGGNELAGFDPLATGRELAVEFVLDGHIQRHGKRIRVSVQLLNVLENSTVWAERFDDNFTDVLSLEDTISTRVAEALVPHLTGDEREQLAKRGTEDAEAFEAYLRGRYHFNTFTEEGFAKAIVAYNEAIALDADYALAYAGIADYYCWLGVYGVLPPQECFAAAREAATRAIAIDEKLSEAHAALGFAAVAGDRDWRRGEAECRLALELNPNNAAAHVWYSLQLFMEGRFVEGETHARRGMELDPLTPFNSYNLAWCLYFARKFGESIAVYEKTTAANPLYALAFYGLSWSLRYLGRYDAAIEAIERGQVLAGEGVFFATAHAQALAAAGQTENAREMLAEIERTAETRFVSPYHLAIVYNFLGEKDKTLELLGKSLEIGEAWIVWLGVEPVFDNLRADSRFMNLLERTGNPIFFRAHTIEFDGGRQHLSQNTTQPIGDSPTADGEKDLMTADNGILPPRRFSFTLKLAIAAVFLLAILTTAFFATRYGWQMSSIASQKTRAGESNGGATAGKIRSIAVLPFTTVDAKTDDEQYLGVGTADLVTSKLSQLKTINLRAATSVRRYLKTMKPAIEAGKELAVDFVVSGTIQRENNTVAARLKMIEVATGATVWTENFVQPNDNLFALQDAISERIADALSLQLTSAEKQILAKHFTENSEAGQLYLAGRFQFGKRTLDGLKQAISLFEQAIEKDPKFAFAYSGLADCYALLNWYQEPPPADAWENAKRAAIRGVELDDNLAEAHASRAFVKFHYEKDFSGAEAEFKRAIALKPNYATSHQWYGFFLSAQARHDEAIAEMRSAESLEPRSAVIALAVANVMHYARRYDEAVEQAKRALEINPDSVGAYAVLRWNYEKKGLGADALATYEKEKSYAGDTPTTRAKQAHVFAAAGRTDEARKILDELIQNRQAAYVTPYEIAVIYSLLNDRENGLQWLKKAKDEHAVGFSFVRVDPLLDNLRKDSRFADLLP